LGFPQFSFGFEVCHQHVHEYVISFILLNISITSRSKLGSQAYKVMLASDTKGYNQWNGVFK